MTRYPIPARENQIEYRILNSRFIATVAAAFSVNEARQFISRIKTEYPDATHHVPAYIIGFGASTTSHCSDDGEPAGTAGRPALTVLNGSGLGDVVVVVTRYYGGVKLGTGGLVRAYSEAVRQVLEGLPRAEKIAVHTILIVAPYAWYDRLQIMLRKYNSIIVEQDLAADVTLTVQLPVENYADFQANLTDASNGSLQAVIISTEETILPIQ